MRKWLLRIAITLPALALLLALGAVGAWWASPHWLPGVAQHYAPRFGVDLQALELEAPRMDGVRIRRLAFTRGNLRVDARDVVLAYERKALQQQGRLQSAHVARLDVVVGPAPPGEPSKPLPDPRTLWQLLPLDTATIDAFTLALADPAVRLHGGARFSSRELVADIGIDAPAQAAGYRLRGRLTRAGQLVAALRTPAPESALVADVDAAWRDDADAAPAGQAGTAPASEPAPATRLDVSVRAAPTPAQLKALSALAGITTRAGALRVNLATRLPWPLPTLGDRNAALAFARTLKLDGAVTLDWQGEWPGRARSAELRANARFSREGDSVVVQVDNAMLLRADLILDTPVALFAQTIPTRFRLEGRTPLRVQLAGDALQVRGQLHADIGDASTWIRADVRDADARMDALADGRFDGLRTHANLDLQLDRTSFARFTARAQLDVRGDARELALTVRRDARVALGRLGDWTRGTTTARARRDIAVRLQPTGLRWRVGDVRADVTLPKGEFAGTPASFAPATLHVERAEGQGGSRVDAFGALTSTVSARDNGLRFDAGGKVQLRGDASHAEIRARIGKSALPVSFVSDYDLRHKRGRLRIADTLTWTSPLLSGLLQHWKVQGDSARGTLRVDVTANYRFIGAKTVLEASGSVDGEGIDGTYVDYRLLGAGGHAAFTFANDALTVKDGELRMKEAFVGLPIRAIQAGFALTGRQLATNGVQAELLGGKVRTNAFTYGLDDGNADLRVSIDGLDLAEILKLQDQALTGTGTLDGTLPVRVRGNVPEVQDGSIVARPPGGTIAYAKASEYAKNIGQQGFEFAIAALSDFHYTRMESGIDYDRNDVLGLKIKLYGHNPEVENGRPINYNLNVSQNVLDLLRSLRATDEVSRRLENRLQHR